MYILSVLASIQYSLKRWPEFYLAFLCFFFIRCYLKNKNKVMVHWPIVDMLPSLLWNLNRMHDWIVDISNTMGSTRVERGPFLAPLNILYTCDPSNIEYIVRTNFSNFPKGADYKETFDILGDGLFNSDYDLWHSQRIMARMTFASKKVRNIFAGTSRKVVQGSLLPLLGHIAKESKVVNLEDVFLRFTFDTTFSIIFGRNPNYLSVHFPFNEFAQAMDYSTQGIFYRHVVPNAWWKLCRRLMIGNEKKFYEAWKTIDRHLDKHITAKREDFVKGTTEANDLLQLYMSFQANKEKSELFSVKGHRFLRDTALTFLFAGRDTTGVALSWFFWLVSKNPRVEKKILDELKLILSKKNTKEEAVQLLKEKEPWVVFDSDDIKGMVYLHAALCETLRLYPSLPLNRKGALRDDLLPDGTVVKPGMMIIISNYAAGRMEWVWGKDCLEFKPERWIGEDGRLNPETMSKLLTFSVGPRTCLGKNMAFNLMKIAASSMLFNFHVEVLEGQIVEPKPSIVLQMKNGYMVRIKERMIFSTIIN